MTTTYKVRQITPDVARLLAPNPSVWTLEGTNTWIVGAPDADERAVIDPGPVDEGHLGRIVEALGGRSLTQIWLTHSHGDHAAAASTLAERTGATIFSARPREEPGQQLVADGEVHSLGGVPMRVHAFPGHTRDSLGFELEADVAIFTGDTILGKGSSAVGAGLMGDMLATLARIEELAEGRPLRGFPGHGAILNDLGAAAASRLSSRRRRIAEVEAQAQAGATVDEITAALYAHVDDETLRFAARHTVVSILDYISERDSAAVIGAAVIGAAEVCASSR